MDTSVPGARRLPASRRPCSPRGTRAIDLHKLLERSNSRFKATMKNILERYNQPFEDDLVISMENLTYHTPEGPKQWEKVTAKKIKKLKKEVFEAFVWVAGVYVLAVPLTATAWQEVNDQHEGRQTKADGSEPQTSEFENTCSIVYQEGPESSHMDTSYTDEESDADINLIRRKCEDIHLQNPPVVDGPSQKKVQVDVIVQDETRKIPKWIMKAPQHSSEGLHLALPVQEPIGTTTSFGCWSNVLGNKAVCRKKLELPNEWSSSRHPQLYFPAGNMGTNQITIPSHQPSPELNKTYFDSILEEDGEGFWSNMTIADLYPAMVELLKRLMVKQAQREHLEHMLGHLWHKRCHSRRPKLNVTVDKIRGFRPLKLRQALPSIRRSTSEDIWNQTYGKKNREFSDDKCCKNDLSDLVPYPYVDTNESKVDCSDSSLEHHLVAEKGTNVFKQTVHPDAMAGRRKTFLVENELQTPVFLKNSKEIERNSKECKESEKLSYKCSSECHLLITTDSSGSVALNLVKDTETPKNSFPCSDTTVLCSPNSRSYGNSDIFIPVTNSSLAAATNTLLRIPERTVFGRQIAFQHKDSFSSLSIKHSPSKMPQKNDLFEELYYKLCCSDIPKPATVTRPLPNSQSLEEKGRLVRRNLSTSVMSDALYDREFDRIYEELCCEGNPNCIVRPGLKKAEEIQMSGTVKALVISPVQNKYAILGHKRLGNFKNDHIYSPLKRQKNVPECNSPTTNCQQITQRKNVNLQTVNMEFLSTYNLSKPSLFEQHNSGSQDSEFHASSDKTSHGGVGTSVQESRIAAALSDWPIKRLTGVPKIQEYDRRVSRKLSYTDGKE